MIHSRTRLIALLGHPVAHSLSPRFQNAALRFVNIQAVYLAFDVPADRLGPALQGLEALGAVGANLTVPHKETALPHLDRVSSEAKRVGAVNTVLFRGNEKKGYNTDIDGFRGLLQRHSISPGGPVVLLGAGGAARAVVCALADYGVVKILCVNRSRKRAEQLKAWTGVFPAMELETTGWEGFMEAYDPCIKEAEGIINATSLGLAGELPPLPWENLPSLRWLVDTVYAGGSTPLVGEAKRRGIFAVDGTDMLLFQGASAFTLFTGKEAPLHVMEQALRQEE